MATAAGSAVDYDEFRRLHGDEETRGTIDGARLVDELWPAADLSVLGGGRTIPPTMPTGLFGDAWPLISDLAEGAGAPLDYVAMSILGVSASLIGGKRRAKPYEHGTWAEPAILWCALVGDPSTNKSPALDAAAEPLWAMEAEHALRHKEVLQRHEEISTRAAAENKLWKEAVAKVAKSGGDTPPMPFGAVVPDEPVRRRLIVTDATPEAIQVILSGNPSGTLHLSDELAGWLMSFERYSPGGREFWLAAFGGRPHTVDRKGGGGKSLNLPFNGVSVVGGIQPEKLSDCLLKHVDDGLVPRFLWAWPDPVPYHRPRNVADVGLLESIYARLDGLLPATGINGLSQPIVLPLEAKAADVFEAWVREHQAGIGDAASLYKGFCGKLSGITLRLALVAELLAWAVGREDREPIEVSVRALASAIEFVEDYAKPSALRVFGDAVRPRNERLGAALARHIQRRRLTDFSTREVYKYEPRVPELPDAESVDLAAEYLAESGWIRPGAQVAKGPGRPQKRFDVNPAVHDGR